MDFQKGLWLSLAGLGGILIGVWISIEMISWMDWHKNSIALQIVSFLCIFICSFFLMKIAARLVKKIIDYTAIGIIDRLLGAALSLCSWGGLISIGLSLLNGTLHLSYGPVGHFLEETGSWILNIIDDIDLTQTQIN